MKMVRVTMVSPINKTLEITPLFLPVQFPNFSFIQSNPITPRYTKTQAYRCVGQRPPVLVPQQKSGPVELLFGLHNALLATSHDPS